MPDSASSVVPSIVGHPWARRVLDRAVADNRVRHAYLFHGPASVGKSTAARWLALRLNCTGSPAPCGRCRTCVRIAAGRHPDVRSLQAAADHGEALGIPIESDEKSTRATERALSIGQVRALQHDASLAPHEAAWKVYIVVGASALSLPAANCLLKTLEEPAERVVLVLTASDNYEMLPTIVSRCQTLRFGLVPIPEIAAALARDFGCSDEKALLLARLSGGRPGWAIGALANPVMLNDRIELLDELAPVMSGGYRDRLGVAEKIASGFSRDPHTVLRTLSTWRVWWWDVFLIQNGCRDLVTNVDRFESLDQLAGSTTPEGVSGFLRRLADASQQLAQNVNPRLALENLLINTPAAG